MSDWAYTQLDEIRFADVDALGHLNNVAFLTFVESARVGYLASLLPGYDPTLAGSELSVVVASAQINYRSPGSYGELVHTRLRPGALGRTSFRLQFEMAVGERPLADGDGVFVCYDTVARMPIPLPEALRARLSDAGA